MEFPIAVAENVALAPLTTLGVGGPARFFARPGNDIELAALLRHAAREQLSTFVLGGGSNILVADRGFDGLVIQPSGTALEIVPQGNAAVVRAGAALEWDSLVAVAVAEGLQGIESLSGIPGRVGAAPIQNIGAYGQEIAESLATVFAVDRRSGRSVTLKASRCGFGYRTSRFKTTWRDRYVVTGLELRLPRQRQGRVRYPELAAQIGSESTLAAIRAAILALRREKSMLLDIADPNSPDPNRYSAGSFFLNPLVSAEAAAEAGRRHVARGGTRPLPAFPAAAGKVKLSAAWLIEEAGFPRGYPLGSGAPAGLSTRHTLALVNRGGASAADLLALAAEVRQGVVSAFGVTLEPEPVFLGFADGIDALLR